MDGPAFDVTELPPKRGAPPKFRRNRVATIATLCVLGFAAGMGVQWGMLHRGPPSAPPANATPKRALLPTVPRKHTAMTVGSDAPAPNAVAPVETAAVAAPSSTTPHAAEPGSATPPRAPSAGLSRDALDYGRRAEAQASAPTSPQPAPAPVQVASVETPPAPVTRPAPAAEPPARAKTPTRKATSVQSRPDTVRVSAGTAPTRPLAAPARPSFDCSRATSPGERQVCGNPGLAALDARMDSIYRRALSSARDPRALKADQDRWMAVREGAALRDPSMVGPAYERRIAELSRRDW